MARRLTTNDLIAETRSLIDESGQISISDKGDIIPSLCRAQDTAANILASHYQSPLLTYIIYSTPANLVEYPIPPDAFEQRLEKLEVLIQPNLYNPVNRISYRDATFVETPSKTSFPMYYSEIGDKFRLYPQTTGAYPLRIWYLKDPQPLVQEQGTVTRINTSSNSIVVDQTGPDLTAEADSVSSYVNFVDGTTGALKGTCQIASFDTRSITFRTTPTRTTVLGLTVSGALPVDLAADDLICTAEGTCISILKKPFANFLISMAASELLNTKLGIPSEMGEKVRQEMEKMVAESWAGRETYLRIKNVNPSWERIGRTGSRRY